MATLTGEQLVAIAGMVTTGFEPPPPPPVKLNLRCDHVRRVPQPNDTWGCPPGFDDTGLTWGMPYPDKQCQSCANKWSTATATYFTSYPACCEDPLADQTECSDYSGCKYRGLFKGLNKKQSKKWVRDNNIVAVYQPPNDRNVREWDRAWKGRRLQLRNPRTMKVMEVTVVDTCDDADCGGCCTRNAAYAGNNLLIDLEYHTAKRFWDGNIDGRATIEWRAV